MENMRSKCWCTWFKEIPWVTVGSSHTLSDWITSPLSLSCHVRLVSACLHSALHLLFTPKEGLHWENNSEKPCKRSDHITHKSAGLGHLRNIMDEWEFSLYFIHFPPRISLVACSLRHDCEEGVFISFFIFILVKVWMDPWPKHKHVFLLIEPTHIFFLFILLWFKNFLIHTPLSYALQIIFLPSSNLFFKSFKFAKHPLCTQ